MSGVFQFLLFFEDGKPDVCLFEEAFLKGYKQTQNHSLFLFSNQNTLWTEILFLNSTQSVRLFSIFTSFVFHFKLRALYIYIKFRSVFFFSSPQFLFNLFKMKSCFLWGWEKKADMEFLLLLRLNLDKGEIQLKKMLFFQYFFNFIFTNIYFLFF